MPRGKRTEKRKPSRNMDEDDDSPARPSKRGQSTRVADEDTIDNGRMAEVTGSSLVVTALVAELDKQESCDVFFSVDGQIIGAHKLVFRMMQDRCKELHNMAKAWSDGDELIVIDVIAFEAFKELLKYIYTGEPFITNENIFNFLSAAVHFEMHHLEQLCINHISNILCTENVCYFMNNAVEFKSKALEERCCELFSKSTRETLWDPTFLQLQQCALSRFLDVEVTDVPEIILFIVIRRWMKKRCTELGVPPDGVNMRKAIGEALNKIRFPTMNGQDFANAVSKIKGFLTESENSQIFQKIMVFDNKDIECPFSDVFRCHVPARGWPFDDMFQLLEKPLLCDFYGERHNIRSMFKSFKELTNNKAISAYSLRLVMQCCADLANSNPFCKPATQHNQNTRDELSKDFEEWEDTCKTKDIHKIMTKFMELRTKLDKICAWRRY